MAKGDKVVVTMDTGAGTATVNEIVADAAGRTVEYDRDKREGVTVVEVRGRAGKLVRKAEFRTERVISIEEIPS